MRGPAEFDWTFIHEGKLALSDVMVRIHTLERANGQMDVLGRTARLGTVFPGRAHTLGISERRLPSHGFNLFFVARNGSWTQEIRWVELPGVIAVANRVLRDGTPIDQPLLLQVAPEFPGRTPANEAWNEMPPYVPPVGRAVAS